MDPQIAESWVSLRSIFNDKNILGATKISNRSFGEGKGFAIDKKKSLYLFHVYLIWLLYTFSQYDSMARNNEQNLLNLIHLN